MSELRGDSFGDGFLAGVVGHAAGGLSAKIGGDLNEMHRAIVAGFIGGVAAEATGGDFANSAIQSATVYLYNSALEQNAKLKLVAKVGDSAFIFDGISEQEVCRGDTSCLLTIRTTPQHKDLMRLSADGDYYVSTETATYSAYLDALKANGAGKVGDIANILVVVCSGCAPAVAPIGLISSVVKFYYEPTAANLIAPLAGHLGGKMLFSSGRLTANQAASGGAGVEFGAGLIYE